MDNWAGMVKGAIDGGALYYGVRADVRFSQVATQDIGKVAARLLVEGAPVGTRVVELAGPVDTTLQDTADAISKVAGKPVNAVSVPPAATIEALVGMGASRELAEMYAEMTEAINEGRIRWQGKDLVRGSITLEQKFRELI
ncbi:MAG: NmrA family transcriptional regulator [Deltaproteobacteria bacterium]|nr:NmrA family transcriptional regulator [Deltaproteobacteria bacterium]